jgi:hypothetical protein
MSDHSLNLSNESPATSPLHLTEQTALDALTLVDQDASPDYVPLLPSSNHENEAPLPIPNIFTQPPLNLSDEGPWPLLSPGTAKTALHLAVGDEDHARIAVAIARGLVTSVRRCTAVAEQQLTILRARTHRLSETVQQWEAEIRQLRDPQEAVGMPHQYQRNQGEVDCQIPNAQGQLIVAPWYRILGSGEVAL